MIPLYSLSYCFQEYLGPQISSSSIAGTYTDSWAHLMCNTTPSTGPRQKQTSVTGPGTPAHPGSGGPTSMSLYPIGPSLEQAPVAGRAAIAASPTSDGFMNVENPHSAYDASNQDKGAASRATGKRHGCDDQSPTIQVYATAQWFNPCGRW
eukprot:scaffold259105_cov20-Tisochrysis_lutea.AAC.2